MGFESLPGSFLSRLRGGTGPAASLQRVTAGFAGYLARRFALLLFTLVLVPSLSFCFFQLLEQDIPGPAEMLDELVEYLGADVPPCRPRLGELPEPDVHPDAQRVLR